jgi:hypothetical protein
LKCGVFRGSNDPQREQLALQELTHVLGAHVPFGRVSYTLSHLLVRAFAVGLLGDAVENLGELDEALIAPDEPLPLLETSLFHLTYKLNPQRERRVFEHLWRRKPAPLLGRLFRHPVGIQTRIRFSHYVSGSRYMKRAGSNPARRPPCY